MQLLPREQTACDTLKGASNSKYAAAAKKTNSISDTLKGASNSKYAAAAKRTNSILALIHRSFRYNDADFLLPLYKSLVRPHMNYAIPVWRPHYIKDIELLEKVQRRFTGMIVGFQERSYAEILKKKKETHHSTCEAR